MYRQNSNQTVIELLVKLKEIKYEYPPPLLCARRTSFLRLITRYILALVRI
jgi:hypothetical protein